jgi:hypothetical protein
MSACPHGETGRWCCGYAARGMECPYPRSPVVRFVPAEAFGPAETNVWDEASECPWCEKLAEEHETAPGRLSWVWTCPNAPAGWRGVFTDRPVTPAHDDRTRSDETAP